MDIADIVKEQGKRMETRKEPKKQEPTFEIAVKHDSPKEPDPPQSLTSEVIEEAMKSMGQVKYMVVIPSDNLATCRIAALFYEADEAIFYGKLRAMEDKRRVDVINLLPTTMVKSGS
jgi:hypothetical protein